MSHRQDMDAILKQVEDWPSEDRLALANAIIVKAGNDALRPPPRDTLSQAIGLGRGDGPPPTDEQVRQWLEEERWLKYGR